MKIKSKGLYLTSEVVGNWDRGKCKRSRWQQDNDHRRGWTQPVWLRVLELELEWHREPEQLQILRKTQPGRHRRVFKGLSKKLGHGISKQQAPGIRGGGGNLARVTKGNPGGSLHLGNLWAGSRIPGTDQGSGWPQPLAGTLWNLVRTSVLEGLLWQASSYGVISATEFRGQRQGWLTDGGQLAPRCGRNRRKSVGSG